MTTTSDAAALLAAIVEHPEEDTPRLMLADEIEGTDPARAEFIRVQVELSGLSEVSRPQFFGPVFAEEMDEVSEYCRLWDRKVVMQRRERELLAANELEWRKGSTCGECGGKGYHGSRAHHFECFGCYHTRDAGGLLRQFQYRDPLHGYSNNPKPEPVRVYFERGLIRRVVAPRLDALVASAYNADLDTTPPQRGRTEIQPNTFRPTPWFRAVLTATPERALIREVVPLDREPADVANFGWYAEGLHDVHDSSSLLPEWLWRQLTGYLEGVYEGRIYPTREDAIAALGQAIVTWARRYNALGT